MSRTMASRVYIPAAGAARIDFTFDTSRPALCYGAVLTDTRLEPDPLMTDFACPSTCTICLDACPQQALDGATVDQALCRKVSLRKTSRGFDVYYCSKCRQACPNRLGYGRRAKQQVDSTLTN